MFKVCIFLEGSDSPTPDRTMNNLTLLGLAKILVKMSKEGNHQFVIYTTKGDPITVS